MLAILPSFSARIVMQKVISSNTIVSYCFAHLAELLWTLSETFWRLVSVQATFLNFPMTLVSSS